MKKTDKKPRVTYQDLMNALSDLKDPWVALDMMKRHKHMVNVLINANDNQGNPLFTALEIDSILSQCKDIIETKPEIIIATLEDAKEVEDICGAKNRVVCLWHAVDEPSKSVIKRAEQIKSDEEDKDNEEAEVLAVDMLSKNELEKIRKTINTKLKTKLKKAKPSSFKRVMIKIAMKLVPEKLGERTAKAEQKIADVVYREKKEQTAKYKPGCWQFVKIKDFPSNHEIHELIEDKSEEEAKLWAYVDKDGNIYDEQQWKRMSASRGR